MPNTAEWLKYPPKSEKKLNKSTNVNKATNTNDKTVRSILLKTKAQWNS